MSTVSSLPSNPEPNDNGEAMPSDGGGKNLGEALSKFDFSQIDPAPHADQGSQAHDPSDVHAALASMSSEDALDYAISHIGSADHLDAGHVGDAEHVDAGHFDGAHFDMPDTSHDA